MKGYLMLMLGAVLLRTCETRPVNYAPPTPVSFQEFYDELSPYGDWVEDPNYGYAWVPEVDDDFRPYYTDGNWVMTDQGNTWVSDYPWGWAPFHYGNWAYTAPHGWTWVPGYDWAPAHVSWREGNGYYGWAPLMPGLGINVGLNGYNPPVDWWVFVPQPRLYDNSFYRYWPGPQYNPTIFPYTTYITNVYKGKSGNTYIFGPTPDQFARVTGKKVKMRNVVDVSRPGAIGRRSNALRVYRPQVKEDKLARPSPDKVTRGWGGKSQRGNQNGNQQMDRDNQQRKAPLEARQPERKQNKAGGRQQVQPERENKPERNASPQQKAPQRSAPARKENKPSAQPQRSSAKPVQQRPAERKHAQPAKQQHFHSTPRKEKGPSYQQAQPRHNHSAQQPQNRGGESKSGGQGKQK